ncbi:MAG: tryptophan--tRNA ligase [Candidatus Pacearchaeota archaeon]
MNKKTKHSNPLNITPWEVEENINYEKLIKEFGTSRILENIKKKVEKCHPLLKREIYFSHRDFDKWLSEKENGKVVSVLTGRGPSEKMHLGHLVPFIVAKNLQDIFNCEVYIPISDDEKFFVKKDLSFEDTLKYAEDNILDLIALGFKEGKTFIFQDFKYQKIYPLAAKCAKKITYSTVKAIFGLNSENNVGWSFYPAVQVAHILFPQFHKGKHMTLVPVGIDQDPFIRLTRDIAESFGFEKPASLYAKFIPSLHGGIKMSASNEGNIWLSDNEREVEKKIKKYAFSGGQATLEEHRKKGGNPNKDVSFQYLKIFFEENDKKLEEIEKNYKTGKMTTGELKEYTIKKINNFLKEHQKRKKLAEKKLNKFILK